MMDVAQQLDREWLYLARAEVAAALPRWRRQQEALRPFSSVRALLSFLHSAPAEQTDAPLLALLRLARGERLAGRTLLQVVLPALKRRADRIVCPVHSSREEVWELLLLAAWEAICCYPLERRRTRVAANLILQVVHQTTRELRHPDAGHVGSGEVPAGCAAAPASQPAEAHVLRGVAGGAISAADADLILLTRVDGIRLRVCAGTLGVNYAALLKRRQRAEAALRALLASESDVRNGAAPDPVFDAPPFRLPRSRAAVGTPPDVRTDRAA